MSTVLHQVLGRAGESRALVGAVADALGSRVAVEDCEGRLLFGHAPGDGPATRFPVTYQSAALGWVVGPAQARAVATLLEHLVARTAERKALGSEVLHLYREVNLIYSFSEKLASLLDVERVGALTLQEARRVIAGTDGVLMLLDDGTDRLAAVAGFGTRMPRLEGLRRGHGVVGTVAATGVGEIVNDLDLDPRRGQDDAGIRSQICAPLKVGERVIGVIALGSTSPMTYTAAELKLLTTLALQTATAIENARLFERTVEAAVERERLMALQQETELARAKLESELGLAARIQADLFPARLPDVAGYELAARNRPARRCGGDYYDALALPSREGRGALLFCVADVAGKGLPAALVMSNTQATLRALLARTDSLAELAAYASALLYGTTAPEKYVTAALVELTPETGALTFVGAGHLDNLVLRASGETVRLVSTGTPLGLLPPGLPYQQTSHTLAAGDTLWLFSDGVTEAQNATGEEFGETRLLEVLRERPGEPIDASLERAFQSLDAFAGGAPQFDDMTMVAVRRRPAASA